MADTSTVDEIKHIIRSLKDEKYNVAVEHCNKLLLINPNDEDALRTKAVCWIQNNNFNSVASEFKGKLALATELAYAYYRQGEHKMVLELLSGSGVDLTKETVLHLKAQANFSLGNYNESVALYETLCKKEGSTIECKTNLLAAYILAGKPREGIERIEELVTRDESFELTFNIATSLLESGNMVEAEKKINEAMVQCRKMQAELGAGEDEIVDELCVMQVQLAYILQLKGKLGQSEKLYESVLQSKPSSKTVAAVCVNNLLSLKQKRDLNDSFKKFKGITTHETVKKLTNAQQVKIDFNHALLLLYLEKNDLCLAALQEMQKKYPNEVDGYILEASLSFNKSDFSSALNILNAFAAKNSNNSYVWLVICWIHISSGNKTEAAKALSSIPPSQRSPAITGTILKHFSEMNLQHEAEIVLLDAIKDSKAKKDDEYVVVFSLQLSTFYCNLSRYNEAANVLESLLKGNTLLSSQKLRVKASLALVYSSFSADKAELNIKELPIPKGSAEDESLSIDDLLELSSLRKSSKSYSKSIDVISKKDGERGKGGDSALNAIVAKRKKIRRAKSHKKRRMLFREIFFKKLKDSGKFIVDFKPDVERWLPFRQRAKGKKMLKKKGMHVSGGAQGAGDAANLAKEAEKLDVRKIELLKEEEEKKESEKSKTNKNQKKKKGKGGKW